MGCGVSKDCIADPSLTRSKKRLIHACREHLQNAISVDKQPASATAVVVPHHEYTHLRETLTLEEQGDADIVTIDEHDEHDEDDIDINVNENDIHFPVHEEEDHINANEVITINPDDSEYLENKPPASQPLTLHRSGAYATRSNARASPGPQKAIHKPPLRELSIDANGKLDVKKDHLGIFTIHTSSTPRSNNYHGGISPSCPSVKVRSSSCSPLHADKVKLLSPMCAWNPLDAQSPNFIKSFADHQLCKEGENTENEELKVVGHSYNPLPASKTSVVEFDCDNQTEEIFKSNTDAIIDGFIEDLQQDAFDSNQLTSRLVAYGNLTGSPNSYMKELLEHFDKSTESLHMPTTPRAVSWQSKLLETIDRDIDSILLEEQSGVAALSKDQNSSIGNHHIDHTRYDSIEL